MNCIIVDDEPLAREELGSLLAEITSIDILGKFSNALKALEFLKTQTPDLVFLDIEMPGMTGLEFAKCIPDKTLVVFTTAFPQYALKSYELDAMDYLLKPIDKQRLAKAIQKAEVYKQLLLDKPARSTVATEATDCLLIKSDRKYHRLNLKDILFIEGLKDYVIIQTKDKKLITAMNLKTIHQKLPPERFLRVSKSYVVHIEGIDSFDNHTLYVDKFEVPLGEVYRKDFFKIYTDGLIDPEQ